MDVLALYQKLALLTDTEAELCLNGILKGFVSLYPKYEELLASPEEMKEVIQTTASNTGEPLANVKEVTSQERPKAIRMILTEIVADPVLSPRLEAWLNAARPTLLDPVTSALVLAGIIFLLSTHIDIEYEGQKGQKKLKIKIEKKPTSRKILEKFFTFFK